MSTLPLLSITLARSLEFARLSGDFNPMHVDPVRARRTQYGGTVVHGMHLLLSALDAVSKQGLVSPAQIESLSVVFSNPALTGVPVALSCSDIAEQGRLRIVGEHEGRTLFTATLVLQASLAPIAIPPDAEPQSPATPVERDMPSPQAAGELRGAVPWQLPRALFEREFPSLARQPGGDALAADLLASTRVVGMECPGLHSIYSALKLRRVAAPASAGAQAMRWQVTKTDARFRLARLLITGGMFEGSIDSFFRPPPVQQMPLSGLLGSVPAERFAGQRALVVGGSRGLGELTAKLLLAGDADVTITYARGLQDAERVCQEAISLGRRCVPLALDLRDGLQSGALPEALRGAFTHIYFFASPQIAKGVPGQWRAALFEEFSAFYLRGFADLLAALTPARGGGTPIRVLYPSTVFIETREKGFAEYCAAKAAGETLCGHLAAHHGMRIDHPRLPRMRTDQTSGLMDSDTEDAVAVMRRVLDAFIA